MVLSLIANTSCKLTFNRKAYQEDYPGNCFTGDISGKYVRKHNPFISFDDVRKNSQICEKIVNAKELELDLLRGTLPQFSYYTPNNNNNGHDTGLKFAGTYLNEFFLPKLAKFPKNTLIIITWDEDDYLAMNHIHTVAIGNMVERNSIDDTAYNHHSLLKTVEDNWELGNLGRGDVNANSYQFLKKL